MCLNPIKITNPSKVISLATRDPYYLYVPCGQCAECQRNKSTEWYFRNLIEFQDCINRGGYVLFDTLTYNNQSLPHMSDFIPELKDNDFPCFSYRDTRLFRVNLRKRLTSLGFDVKHKLKIFVVSEYGTKATGTHRPHYHLMVYCLAAIEPEVLSHQINDVWNRGRTDGIDYYGYNYLINKRVFRQHDQRASFLVAQYVCKYVQKESSFSKEIEQRVAYAYDELTKNESEHFHHTSAARKLRLNLRRICDQFHRQDKFFGASILNSVSKEDLLRDPHFYISDPKFIKRQIPIFSYYKRKLCHELVELSDGYKSWQLTDYGKKFKLAHHEQSIQLLEDNFRCFDIQHGGKLSSMLNSRSYRDLAVYLTDYQGRIKSDNDNILSLADKMDDEYLFNYVTPSDYERFGNRFLTTHWLGYSEHYSDIPCDAQVIFSNEFGRDCVIDDTFKDEFRGFDDIYQHYLQGLQARNHLEQEDYDERQRLEMVYGAIFPKKLYLSLDFG